jgi:hypothetical protein
MVAGVFLENPVDQLYQDIQLLHQQLSLNRYPEEGLERAQITF